MMDYQPVGDRVLVRPVRKINEKTESGILLDTVKKTVLEGEIVAAGNGRYATDTGNFIPMVLAKGDVILFGAETGMPISLNGEELLLMHEHDVILLVRGAKQEKVY